MKIIKPRYVSEELKLLRCLNARMKFSETELNYYLHLEKGLNGEQLFDQWLENLSIDCFILNDLLYEINNTIFQIDTLLITRDKLYLFEVKNYEGDFYIDNEKWFTRSGTEIKNPLLQLKRSESLLRRLLQDLKFDFTIEAYVIFINPDFHLYQAPLNLPIIFPTQLNRFINELNKKTAKLDGRYSKLTEQIVSKALNESPFTRLPNYSYDRLNKGILCANCHSFVDKSLVCSECGSKEDITATILRSVDEFRMLFPSKRLTTNIIHEWCKEIHSKKTIRRVLSSNFKLDGHGRSSHFIN